MAWNSSVLPRRLWILALVLPVLPDADVVMFRFGVPYEHWLGHRGFFHSLTFAMILAVLATTVFFSSAKWFSRRWLGLTGFLFGITALHGILDAFTNGGLGIALLAPFDNTRYFFGFQPIEVSPLGLKAFFSDWGLKVLLNEALWVWLPLGIAVAVVRLGRRLHSA